jgi:hypothetical protein
LQSENSLPGTRPIEILNGKRFLRDRRHRAILALGVAQIVTPLLIVGEGRCRLRAWRNM